MNDEEFEIDPAHYPLYVALENIHAMNDGLAKLAAAEELCRQADQVGIPEIQVAARMEAVRAASFSGNPDVLLVMFSWLLAKYEQEPELFHDFEFMWQFKWVVGPLCCFPQISRYKIFEMLESMKKHYTAFGLGKHAIAHSERDIYMDLGDIPNAVNAHARLQKTKIDELSDCKACLPNANFRYYLLVGEPEKALESIQDVLAGKLKCAHVPHSTYGNVLFPLLKLGRVEEAMQYHHKGYRLVKANPGLIRHAAQHCAFLALTGNLDRALRLLTFHWDKLEQTTDVLESFRFYMEAWVVLDIRQQGKKKLAFKQPKALPEDVDALVWLTDKLQEYAAQFDARNGNDFYSRMVSELNQRKDYAADRPYTGTESK